MQSQEQKQGKRMWIVLTIAVCVVGYLVNGITGSLVGLVLVASLWLILLIIGFRLQKRGRTF
jgi:hypothetical protein